ncbi:hypothetical protein Tco_0129178, partial [Tanacetum coccineum]
METHKPLLKDADSEDLDKHMYRSMIGSLMYLTSSRPDIMFVVCVCAGLQVNPKVSHLHVMKRIFRLISWQCKKQTVVANSTIEAEYVAASSCFGQVLWIQNQLLDYGDSNEKKQIQMIKIHTDKNVADLLIKAFDLQTLVDGKKIIITESTIRGDLQLKDAEGIDCLPNAAIFEQLTLMGYEKLSQKLTFYKAFFSPQWKFLIHTILQCLSAKTTAWNEFSSIMASAIICLATNQKFNFSKYIFDRIVKNLDNVNTFLMYPRFVQMFVNQQAGDMSNHKRIYVTPSHTKKVFGNMKREGKGFSGRVAPLFPTMMVQAQQEQGEVDEAINEENVPTHSNDPLLSGEDRLKLKELMALCTNLQNRVLDLEHINTTQTLKIDSFKRRVKKLEKKQRSRTHGLRRLYKVSLSARVISSEDEGLGEEDASKQGRKIHDIDDDEDITLENVHDEYMFDTVTTVGEVVTTAKEVSTTDSVTTAGEVVTTANVEVSTASPTDATITIVELTLAQTLTELKSARPKTKGVVMQELSETTTTIPSKDKGKGIMVEEPLKMKKKDQVLFDEQEAIRLQAQFDEEERMSREKEKANVALMAQWNDIQDKVETDYELAQRLQAEEQEELTIKEKSKLFQQLLEKRRKHFAAKRAEERRNRPPTKAQQRSIMCTYLKNMAGWKPKDLKTKPFANVQELFDKVMKRVNAFVDMDTELVGGSEVREEGSETKEESSSKRAGDELEQETSKKEN